MQATSAKTRVHPMEKNLFTQPHKNFIPQRKSLISCLILVQHNGCKSPNDDSTRKEGLEAHLPG